MTQYAKLRKEARRITLHFTPSWFSVNMGTGITSVLLYQLPYQFKGLRTIANVIFGLNVTLFVIFLVISILRYLLWPTMWKTMLYHPGQSLFVGTFAMGLATIVNMCALSLSPSWGSKFAIFTWALWWIDSVISFLICVGLPFVQFTRHNQSPDNITGVWLLPVVSTVVAASSGGIVAEILSPSNARLTLIISWILWGIGFSMAFIIMTLYYFRLSIYKIPPAAMIVSVFLPVGPCGQGAFGLLKLSSVLYDLSKSTGETFGSSFTLEESHQMAIAIYAVTITLALVIWGLGLVWLLLAVAMLIDMAIVQQLTFNIGWWGFTFPIGVFCTATVQLGHTLNSNVFRVIGTILSVVEVILWLYIATKTLTQVSNGGIFFSPCLAESGGEPPKRVASARKYDYVARPQSPRRGGLPSHNGSN